MGIKIDWDCLRTKEDSILPEPEDLINCENSSCENVISLKKDEVFEIKGYKNSIMLVCIDCYKIY